MSLRLRLNLLFIALLGGAILLFGALVYWLVSFVLIQQVDNNLLNSSRQLTSMLRVNTQNQVDPRSITNFQTTDNLLFQVWGTDRKLQIARPPSLQVALDEEGRQSGQVYYHSSNVNGIHLRVMSIPLETERGPLGVLQVALNLQLLDIVQTTLASILLVLVAAGMLLSGIAAWLITGRALAPLATMTQVATQITHADDLSRRIPRPNRSGDDEVSALIEAFNATLERLEKLFNMQRRFLADVSHELRTPLTVIKGNVGLVRKFGADEESLSSIEAEVDRLTRMVGDLLLLAQAESGSVPFDRVVVELDTILFEVFQQMRVLAGERVRLQLVDIDQVQVLGDRDRLKQVLVNLVANAIQYTPAGGLVQLGMARVDTEPRQVRITVSDTGPGIPAEDLPHIFERFYRGEKSRTRNKTGGFGLGLSIAYWIARSHGGNIEVESQEGKGTTFHVLLPVHE